MIEKAGVLYFRFFCYLYVLFSFLLEGFMSNIFATKEKVPKRKNQGCVCPATPVSSPAKGQKLASLKQSALLNAGNETSA